MALSGRFCSRVDVFFPIFFRVAKLMKKRGCVLWYDFQMISNLKFTAERKMSFFMGQRTSG